MRSLHKHMFALAPKVLYQRRKPREIPRVGKHSISLKRDSVTDRAVNIGEAVSTITSSLLGRVQSKERVAWERLVDVYSPLVYWWCKQHGLNGADAADIGQEVFLAVARSVDRFRRDGPIHSFRGWLRTITANKVRDLWRRENRVSARHMDDLAQVACQSLGRESNGADSCDTDEIEILYSRVVALIRSEFNEKDWLAFLAVTQHERPPRDVAEELGMSRNQVYLARSRILRRVRELFGHEFGGDRA